MSTAAATPLTIDQFFGSILNLTTALNRVADNQDRLIAGQEAAIAKVEAAKPARAPRKAAAEPTPEPEPAADEASEKLTFKQHTITDAAALEAYAKEWTGGAEGDEKVARVQLLKDMAAHFGCAPKFAEFAADADRLKQVVFFIERKKAGLDVNLKADYDFDAEPTQGGAPAAAADESDFG